MHSQQEDRHKSRIFISYSHRGNGPEWKEKLLKALHVFEQQHLLDVWQDGKIRVSSYWDDDIKQAMASAGLAVVLLTQEALESEYILREEFPFLRELQQNGTPVFPVICEECDWRSHEWLRATQAPNESNPLSQLSATGQERVFRNLATTIAEELSRVTFLEMPKPASFPSDSQIYLDKFPLTSDPGLKEERLVGREQELALLDLAFFQSNTAIVSLVAWGGVGKTMLMKHWMKRIQRMNWHGIQRVYARSFYSQGTKEDRQASEDSFLSHALEWFGIQCEPTLPPWDKGRLLANAISHERTLLILDGIEPLQYPPGPIGGQLRAPGVHSLLKTLARESDRNKFQGLCLVSTREPLTDLVDFQRRPDTAWGSVLRVDLGNLIEEAGAALLYHAGVNRAGAAEIKADDNELVSASREVDGHALTLNLLGRFLANAFNGDIRRRDLVKFDDADRKEQGGTTFKMLSILENWFSNEGDIEERSLAILRLLGLFDRPANTRCLATLRESPPIAGLTEPLFRSKRDPNQNQSVEEPLSDKAWNYAIQFLVNFGLVSIKSARTNPIKGLDYFSSQIMSVYGPNAGVAEPVESFIFDNTLEIDTHPLIRQYLGTRLKNENVAAYITAHNRLFDLLNGPDIPFWPNDLDGLQPLYQGIIHGCNAGLHKKAFETFMNRVMRGTGHFGFFTTNQLGAFSEDLTAMTCFFENPWTDVSSNLSLDAHAWLLNGVSHLLRGLGRLCEAEAPSRASLDLRIEEQNWRPATNSAFNLSGLNLTLGNIEAACELAERAVVLSRHPSMSGYSEPLFALANFARARFEKGDTTAAMTLFHEAELILSDEPECDLLYGVSGADYCDLLLADVERACWRWLVEYRASGLSPSQQTKKAIPNFKVFVETINSVSARLGRVLRFMAGHPETSLVSLGVCQLTLLRVMLYRYITGLAEASDNSESFSYKTPELRATLDLLRRSRVMEFFIPGLLTTSWFKFLKETPADARIDLDEAWDIAERGPMRLHMADIHLYRARLFFKEEHYPWKSPREDLVAAEKLINECGYHRRDEELADAKRVILGYS
jgi:hypothetical protein